MRTASIQNNLRPYQEAGVGLMVAKAAMNRDVLLADEPGLGKTIQAIEYANRTKPGTILVVCPASLRVNWNQELERWLQYQPRVTVASYETVSAGKVEGSFDLIVFDEAHYMKNPAAKRTKACLALKARRRVFMTGTPVVNRPIELFPILKAMGMKWSLQRYAQRYCAAYLQPIGWNPRTKRPRKMVWNYSGASNQAELGEILRQRCMIRRTKAEVLTDLPAKVRQVIEVDAPHGESEEFRATVSRMFTSLETAADAAEVRRVAFEELSAARLETGVRKVPHVVKMVKDILEEEDKVFIVAHHRQVVNALARALPGAVRIMGGMSDREKNDAVLAFQKGDAPVLVGQITAAGVGLTLTAAATVVFAETDWVPGNVTQAEDRCHRIGQDRTVRVIHVTLRDSMDARMIRAVVSKQETLDSILVPGELPGNEVEEPEKKEWYDL